MLSVGGRWGGGDFTALGRGPTLFLRQSRCPTARDLRMPALLRSLRSPGVADLDGCAISPYSSVVRRSGTTTGGPASGRGHAADRSRCGGRRASKRARRLSIYVLGGPQSLEDRRQRVRPRGLGVSVTPVGELRRPDHRPARHPPPPSTGWSLLGYIDVGAAARRLGADLGRRRSPPITRRPTISTCRSGCRNHLRRHTPMTAPIFRRLHGPGPWWARTLERF